MYRYSCRFLAAVLLLAALLKVVSHDFGFTSLTVSVGEVALCILLLSRFRDALFVKVAAGSFFAISIGLAVGKLVVGRADCGCFGDLRVHPALTLMLSLVAESAVIASALENHLACRRYMVITRIVAISCLGIMLIAILSAVGASLAGRSSEVASSDAVWGRLTGHPLPFAREIQIDHDISSGLWTLVFVRPNCKACESVAEEFRQGSELHQFIEDGRRALVYLIPGEDFHGCGQDHFACGKMSDRKLRMWPTPVATVLRDGVVERVITKRIQF